ncbi:MAG TPA: Rrf2 family transcriptional regulator [Cyclobacteriaceae bacterium]|nr:Rrf2 family transcriptional regulator [Cyclobacteriaceae bacterium]
MISKKSKYAIHALVFLASRYGEGYVMIKEIASQHNIPQKFLEAILLDLKKAGILGSKAGKGGGYYLRRDPADVNLAQVIRLFDGAIAAIPCVTYKYYEPCVECTDEKLCGIRRAFLELRNATVELLKKNSLADILSKYKK